LPPPRVDLSVELAEGALGELRAHAEKAGSDHPKYGPGPAGGHGDRDAGDVAEADGRRERARERLEVADLSGVVGVVELATGDLDGVKEGPDVDEPVAKREEDSAEDQPEDDDRQLEARENVLAFARRELLGRGASRGSFVTSYDDRSSLCFAQTSGGGPFFDRGIGGVPEHHVPEEDRGHRGDDPLADPTVNAREARVDVGDETRFCRRAVPRIFSFLGLGRHCRGQDQRHDEDVSHQNPSRAAGLWQTREKLPGRHGAMRRALLGAQLADLRVESPEKDSANRRTDGPVSAGIDVSTSEVPSCCNRCALTVLGAWPWGK